MSDTLREQLAALEHARWSRWMKYLFSRCATHSNGAVEMLPGYAQGWQRQMNTHYANLSEREKDSDRKEADRTIQLILEYKGES